MANNTLDYGFYSYSHLATERLTTIGSEAVYSMVNESARIYTERLNALLASMVVRTTKFKTRYYLGSAATAQPLDEKGNPLPIRPSGYFDVAFPIQGAGTAWGGDRVARALMTLEEANRCTVTMIKADADWMRRHIWASMFYSASWTWPDPDQGNLTIECLANSDSVTYNLADGTTATDNHYLAQAAAISDTANPFDDIYDELMEHPSNSGSVVVYVPTSLKASIIGMTGFVKAEAFGVIPGIASDRMDPALMRLQGWGDEVLGVVNNCTIVYARSLPAGYMIAHAVGAGPVIAQREYKAASLQGLFLENFAGDGNSQERRMIRYAGFGVQNRIGAVVYYVGGASYTEPTGYTAMPLPV